jgi:hypothetical protein
MLYIPYQNDNYNGFRVTGRHYGYPICCIEEFISDIQILMRGGDTPRTEEQSNLATNVTHGFIPCKACMQKMKEQNLKPEDLLIERTAADGWI